MYYRTAIVYPDGKESVVAQLPNLKLARKYHKFYEKYVIEQFKKFNKDKSLNGVRSCVLLGDSFVGYFGSNVILHSSFFTGEDYEDDYSFVVTKRCDGKIAD